METLVNTKTRIDQGIREWEAECAAKGWEERDHPTPHVATTSDPNPLEPSHPVKAEPGVSADMLNGFLFPNAAMGTKRHKI